MPFPTIKHFPQGWKVIDFHQSPNHPRDAVVLCEREVHDDSDCNFVTWYANMIEGGCHLGSYKETQQAAREIFGECIGRMS